MPSTTGRELAASAAAARAPQTKRSQRSEKRIVCKVNTMVGLAEAAASGMGLVLLPCYAGRAVAGLVQLSPPLPELEGELWLLTHPDLRTTARVRAFLDFCTAEISQRRNVIEGMG